MIQRLRTRWIWLQIAHRPIWQVSAYRPWAWLLLHAAGAVRVALAAATQAAWHVVELDRCDTDMWEAVEESYRFLITEGISEGRST